MALIQRIHQPKIGLLPIGDRLPWAPRPRRWVNEFLDLEVIVPNYSGTFDLLSGDPQEFRSLVKRGRVEIPEPGQPLAL